MFRTLMLALLGVLLCLPLLANDLPAAYQHWLDEDVAYLITKQERDEFVALTNNKQRDQFVGAFWARRDPTPNTTENEFKEEHYRRIAFSNEHFAHIVPGWRTDRGRTYILYGPPNDIESNRSVANLRDKGTSANTSYPYEVWHYRHIEGHPDVSVKFVDTCNCGEYRRQTGTANQPDLP